MFSAMKSGSKRRERERQEYRRANGIRMLPSGTVVHLDGIPITLRYSTEVATAPGNWNMIDAQRLATQESQAPTWASTRLLFGGMSACLIVISMFIWRDPSVRPLLAWTLPLAIGCFLGSAFAHRWAIADNRSSVGE